MLPRTSLPQLIGPRLYTARRRLENMIWHRHGEITEIARTAPVDTFVPFSEGSRRPLKPVKRTPFTWGRESQQCWWKLTLPAASGKDTRYLRWDDSAEAILYVDGVPWGGLNNAHQYVPLPAGKRTVWVESACINTGVWTGKGRGMDPNGSTFKGAYLYIRDDEAWGAYHDLDILMQTMIWEYEHTTAGADVKNLHSSFGYRPPLEETHPRVRQMLRRLDEAVDVLDTRGVSAMREALKAIYNDYPADSAHLRAVLTGHAHVDLVWLWPERVGVFKAASSFATALRLFAEYPEMVFGYSQPASYEAVDAKNPELISRIKGAIKKGNWEASGATYVESDTQLACGEALVRAVRLGQDGFRALRGEPSKVLWLPDVFGYSACIPQILQGCGVPYFYTTKLAWSNVTRFPFSSFVWRGHDGSEVVSHITPNCGYNQRAFPSELKKTAATLPQADVHDEFLAPTGYGDGGGGPTEEMCERARRLANLSHVPPTRWGSHEAFFDRLAGIRDRLPVYQGEVYLEMHRGVQTTHSDLKAAFRGLERALQTWEAAHAATAAGPVDEHPWKRLVFAQFHDYIPGSSTHEVYAEHIAELREHIANCQAATTVALARGRGASTSCLFNPLPYDRDVLVDGGIASLPPLAGVDTASLALHAPEPVKATRSSLRSERVFAQFDRGGRLLRLEVDGAEVAFADKAAELYLMPDFPASFDAWDIDRPTLSNSTTAPATAAITVDDSDPQRAEIAFTKPLGEKSKVTLRFSVDAVNPVLHLTCDLDWQEPQTLLKIGFPTAYNGRQVRYGAPFGSILRGQQPGLASDEAKFEVPGSRYAVITDDGEREGLMLITEAKYGFGADRGLLHLSLVRSALVTRGNDFREIRNLPEQPWSDLQTHSIKLALGRYHQDLPREEQPAALADLLYAPVVPYEGRPTNFPFLGMFGGETLLPVWVKPLADGSCVLRLNEVAGARGAAYLSLAEGVTAELLDLNDAPTGEVLVDGEVTYTPYALRSVRLVHATAKKKRTAKKGG